MLLIYDMHPLFKVTMSPDAGVAVADTLESGYIGQGLRVAEFQNDLTDAFGWENVVTVNSCTSAIQLALHLVKSTLGEYVLLPPLSCFATTSAVLAEHLTPRWVDIDPETFNMDLDDLKRKLNPLTRIILLVHFAGNPIDFDRLDYILDEFQSKHGFRPYVIEDCAQALGSHFEGRQIGEHGNICCFSFQSVKLLTTGDGGALVVPKELLQRAKLLRWYGLSRYEDIADQDIREAGFKYHMNDIAATLGRCNLKYIQEQRLIYEQMIRRDHLAHALQIPNEMGRACCGQFPLLVEDRRGFIEKLKEHGFESRPAHYRCDKHSCVRAFRTPLPGMDLVEQQMTMIPCGWWVPHEEMFRMIKVIYEKVKIPWQKEGF